MPSNPDYLSRLRRIVGRLADSAGMSAKEKYDTKLAITEACANAIRHGSPQGIEDRVSVRFSTISGAVVAEVTDRGGGFDPTGLHSRPTTEPGGLGIPLMRAMTDGVEFLKNGSGMTVRLIKRANSIRRAPLEPSKA
ncbi:MAG: ATP-binding protein [Armatimonadetes bacterium]|nr:ATP-binding protein [Armatimonadota bacterium]